MSTLRIDILNPKAKRLLQDLADLNLIAIKKDNSKSGFVNILKGLRAKAKPTPTLDEITKEVEIVRSKRYVK
jgi:sulfite reductase beta subunit-like hemoprotein